PSSLSASLKPVGGLAFIKEPSSAAAWSTESAPKLMAIRWCEPMVLIASGKGETSPLTVGFSTSSALPPPGFFISRSAISVISNSVATGSVKRSSSPFFSRPRTKSRNESKAISTHSVSLPKPQVSSLHRQRISIEERIACPREHATHGCHSQLGGSRGPAVRVPIEGFTYFAARVWL